MSRVIQFKVTNVNSFDGNKKIQLQENYVPSKEEDENETRRNTRNLMALNFEVNKGDNDFATYKVNALIDVTIG